MSANQAIDEILFDVSPGETRAALVAGGRLVELLVERASTASLVGNIYLGRVSKLAPNIDAAFVELGIDRAGFLARDEARHARNARGEPARASLGETSVGSISRLVSEGEVLLLQVVKDAVGQKGPRLSGQLALPGHWLVYTPHRSGLSVSRRIVSGEERARLEATLGPHLQADEGAIVRTAAEDVDGAALLDDLVSLRNCWQDILVRMRNAEAPALIYSEPDPIHRILRDHAGSGLRRVFCNSREALVRAKTFFARTGHDAEVHLHLGGEPLFARHDVEEQIGLALEPTVELSSGGTLVIGALEALTAIDVNTGRHTGPGRLDDTILATNVEAAKEIAHQVRLRNLAGLIVIDFVHMDREAHRNRVIEALRGAFASDPVSVQLGGLTPLGLFEMTRKRVREPLHDLLMAPCDACHGAGRLKSAETVVYEVLRAVERAAEVNPGRALNVLASADIVAALEGSAKPALQALEARLSRPLTLRIEGTYGREQFDIVTR